MPRFVPYQKNEYSIDVNNDKCEKSYQGFVATQNIKGINTCRATSVKTNRIPVTFDGKLLNKKAGVIAIETIIIGSIVILAGVLIIKQFSTRTQNTVGSARSFVDSNIAAHQANRRP